MPPFGSWGGGGGGGIGDAFARHDQRKAKTYADAIARLAEVQEYNNSFQSPMCAILEKLRANKEHLKNLKTETLRVTAVKNPKVTTDDSERIFRLGAYCVAREEAHEIQRLCKEIGKHVEGIETLQALVEVRCLQLTSPEEGARCEQVIEP